MVRSMATQLLGELFLAELAFFDLDSLTLQRRGHSTTTRHESNKNNLFFPNPLAVAAGKTFKAGLNIRFPVGDNVEAAFQRYRHFLERATRLEMLVQVLERNWFLFMV